jgi:predicted transcriptional regulator
VSSQTAKSRYLMKKLELLSSTDKEEEYHTKIKTVNKRRVLEAIIRVGRLGISKTDVCKDARIDRKNATKYLVELLSEGLIQKSDGKQGKYFATAKIFDDVTLNAKFLGSLFSQKLLLNRYHLPQSTEWIQTLRQSNFVDFSHVPHLRPGVSDLEPLGLLQTLFELSNTIGGYVLFILIQAMNPTNKILRIKGETDDEIIEAWTTESISNIVEMLLPAFKHRIRPHILKNLISKADPYGGLIDYILKEPFYQLPERVINQLQTIFKVLYPLLYFDLDKIFAHVPKEIEADRLFWEYEYIAKKRQASCVHEPQEVHDYDLNGQRMSNRFVMHCRRCHKTWNERKYKRKSRH